MYKLHDFKYNVGYCLFDTFEYLLKFEHTSIEICNGIIDFFTTCLENDDEEAKKSYNHELHLETLKELHNVHDANTYLRRMRLSTKAMNEKQQQHLWGDIFCIH